jgi:hypothetical protein
MSTTDALVHDLADDCPASVSCSRVAEQPIEHRLQPRGHAVEVQRHRENDSVGGST